MAKNFQFALVKDKMTQIIEKFHVLNELNDDFKQRVKILYVCENYKYENKWFPKGYNVLIVTQDDKTYALGNNTFSQLGFGHNRVVKEIRIVKELCDQQIINFANGEYHCVALNSSGKVYCWGWNRWGVLGIESQDESYIKPTLNEHLNNEFVIDISCGAEHSLALTNSGEVYAWGWNHFGQIGNCCNDNQLIPIKGEGFNNKRVVMISCGWGHSMALTECGHVYSWGDNDCGQLGIGSTAHSNEPEVVEVIDESKRNVFIKKISCGITHSLLLSSDGNIYAFGSNKFGEMGNQSERNELTPQKIKMETKIIDISSHWDKHISIALSQNGIYYNWGKCGEEIIRTPKPTDFKSFVDIYAKYLGITLKAINFEGQNPVPTLLRKQENIFKTQIRLEEENGEKVREKKTEYSLRFSVNRFNSQPNETLSRYKSEFKELELLGSGSFGKVCKVINCLDQQQYAVKMILIKGIYESNFIIYEIYIFNSCSIRVFR